MHSFKTYYHYHFVTTRYLAVIMLFGNHDWEILIERQRQINFKKMQKTVDKL